MNANFDISLKELLKHEGGYVDHPKDPGGATNLGVTIGTLSGWLGRRATKDEVRALTVQKVAPIYRENYWEESGANALPSGVDFSVFDAAVNSGPKRAKRWLSAALRANAVDTIKAYARTRLGFLQRLGHWKTFRRGWSSRVAGVEAFSLRLALGGIAKAELPREAAKAKATANKQAAVAGSGVIAVPAAPMAPPAPVITETGNVELTVLVGVVVLCAAFLFWRASINRQRAAAMLSEAGNV
jgi:lysozyme family protein